MTPPALEIRLYLVAPNTWEFLAMRRGEPVACPNPEDRFDRPGKALMGAIEAIKASFPAAAPTEE